MKTREEEQDEDEDYRSRRHDLEALPGSVKGVRNACEMFFVFHASPAWTKSLTFRKNGLLPKSSFKAFAVAVVIDGLQAFS